MFTLAYAALKKGELFPPCQASYIGEGKKKLHSQRIFQACRPIFASSYTVSDPIGFICVTVGENWEPIQRGWHGFLQVLLLSPFKVSRFPGEVENSTHYAPQYDGQ
jgi:hypothetical protein